MLSRQLPDIGEFATTSVAAALRTPGRRRIGHGTHIADDPRLLDELARSGVTLECSLTCNVVLGSAPSCPDHPIRQMVQHGIPITLATDRPLHVATTIGRQYAIAVALGFSLNDLLAFTRNAIAASFTSATRRAGSSARCTQCVSVGADKPGRSGAVADGCGASETVDITTRPATPEDTAFARHVHHEAYREAVERQFGPWGEAVQDRLFLASWQAATYAIVLDDGAPCGYLALEDHPAFIAVREIVIAPAFQGRGIGSFLLRQVLDQARERHVAVRLGTFLVNRAAALYRRLGFRETGRTPTHILFEWTVE